MTSISSDNKAVRNGPKSTSVLSSGRENNGTILRPPGDDIAEGISEYNRALIAYHIVVVLWGFTAILGKLISYGSVMLVWHRCATIHNYLCIHTMSMFIYRIDIIHNHLINNSISTAG